MKHSPLLKLRESLDVETSMVARIFSRTEYAIKFTGRRSGVEYSEGDHAVRVAVETAAAEVDWIIYLRPLKGWLPPHGDELLSEEKSRQVKQRIISGLEFLKIKCHFEE
jgi:hypothetical protein